MLYLNLNLLNERNRLINFDEIPSQYIAVFLGAVFSFFIPSILRSTKDYFQQKTANKHLKKILKEQNSDNPDISIKNIIGILRVLKHEFIRGKITKDQYEILKENIADVLKDLVSKKTNTTTADKE
jgi:histone H3/H4